MKTNVKHKSVHKEFFLELGGRMRQARERTGMSQEALAAQLGIGKSTLIRYEKGGREPTASVVYAWARIAKVDAGWLLAGQSGAHDWAAWGGEHLGAMEVLYIFEDWIAEQMEREPAWGGWVKIELARRFPEFEDWLRQKEEKYPDENE